MDELDHNGKSGSTRPARRRNPVMAGITVATAVLAVLFATGYFAVWFEAELPWMTDVGMRILCGTAVAILFVGWPLAVRHARRRRRREDAAAIDRARETLAGRGVRVGRPADAGRGDRMSLDLPDVREYRHMPWTNANVKSEDRP